MAEDEQKHKGRLAAAVLAGSALTFSSFAIGVPAAMADTTDVENIEETATPEPDAADTSPTPTTVASGTPDDSDDDETDDEDPEEDEKEDAEGAPASQSGKSDKSEEPLELIDISLSEDEGQAGEPVNVTGANFKADGDIKLLLEDATVSEDTDAVLLDTATADADGNIDHDVTIPEDTADGAYNIVAVDTGGSQTAASFTVTSDSDDEDEAEELDPSFHHTPSAGPAGATFDWGVSDFTPNGSVTLSMASADGGDSVDLVTVEADESGSVIGAEATIPEGTANGLYTLTALDVEADSTVESEFNVTDATLTIDPEVIDLDEFREGGSGVTHTVEGLEPGTEVEFHIGTAFSPTDYGGTAVADEQGVAKYVVNSQADDDYLGNYYTTVTLTENGATVATESFEVTSELPQIWLESNEVYQGESLDARFSNLTPDGDFTVEWNPTETLTAEEDGSLTTELAIADDAETGVQEITVTDLTTGESNTSEYTVLEADDQVTEPALIIDPEEITLDDFVGEPDDGAGVAHTVEGIEAGTEISYVVSGPEGVNDFEQTADVDDDGLVEFVIAGYDVSDPSVYLGDYTTVVTYEDENGENEELSGNFSVVTEDGETPGDDNTPGDSDNADDSDDPVDMNGEDLATTGANTAQLGWLAGGLLALGVAFFAHANRARLFGRKH